MNLCKTLLKFGAIFAIWLIIIGSLVAFYFFQGLPSLSDLDKKSDKQIINIKYSNGQNIARYGNNYDEEITYYQLPKNLINAVIATEDSRFFSHFGIDIFGIIRAAIANKKAGKIVQGGSTITQQLAKMLFLEPDRNLRRKIEEVLLAIQLEHKFSKEEILAFYLNRAYFGSGNYGISAAAKSYFNKDVSELNLNESAIIAGLFKAPSKYSPKENPELAENRATIVIRRMIDEEYLNEDDLDEILLDPNYQIDRKTRLYFADYVNSQLDDYKNYKNKTNLTVTTTLNEILQQKIDDSLDKFVKKYKRKIGKSEISIILMNKEGAILGLAGGKDYQKSQFNRAIYAKRQMGSAFKPFIYIAAFEKNYDIGDIFEDKEVRIGNWLPKNYNSKYFGQVTLEESLAKSLNSISIQLAKEIGINEVSSIARKFGILSEIKENDLTISLGTTEVSPLELVSAYASIANDGFPIIPYSIEEISDENDYLLFKRESSGLPQVISYSTVNKIKTAMRSVISEGTGRYANISNDIYGKTGTSQEFRDAWFIGSDDKYILGIWIGNDDGTPTNKISGGSLPTILFADIMGRI
jgi:penicillin-binding protein 1A